VPGHIVAQGMATLPPPSASGPEHREVIVEVKNIGPVRLFVVRKLSRHGRQSHAYWRPIVRKGYSDESVAA